MRYIYTFSNSCVPNYIVVAVMITSLVFINEIREVPTNNIREITAVRVIVTECAWHGSYIII